MSKTQLQNPYPWLDTMIGQIQVLNRQGISIGKFFLPVLIRLMLAAYS